MIALLDVINDWGWNWVAGVLDAAVGMQQTESIEDLLLLSGELFTSSSDKTAFFWGTVNEIMGYVRPLGMALIVTFFIIHMLDLATKDQMTLDGIVKTLIQLIVVVAIMGNLDTIINSMLSIGDSLIYKVNGVQWDTTPMEYDKTGDAIMDGLREEMGDSGWFAGLLEAIALWMIHQISIIAITFAALSRAIEIGWRSAFAPLGCANSFEGGMNSNGIKYLKALFAAILSGAAIYTVAVIGFSLVSQIMVSSDINARLWTGMAALLATAGATIGIGNKVKEWQ